MRHLGKVVVGILLMLNCSVNVVVVGLNRSMWDEPVALLVANLSVGDVLFGFMMVVIGLADVVFPPPVPQPVCVTLQYLVLGTSWQVKSAQLLVALDMLIAVVLPLHYHQVMDDWLKPMLIAPWIMMLINLLIGVVCSSLQLENTYEYGLKHGWLNEVGTDCRWELLPSVYSFIWEGGLFVMSTISGIIFIYASMVGVRQRRAIEERGESGTASSAFFLRRFKSMYKIAKVIILFIALDIIGAGMRVSARWYYIPLVSTAIHFVRIVSLGAETWVYGMNNVSLRRAFDTFCQEHLGFLGFARQVQPEQLMVPAFSVSKRPSLEGGRSVKRPSDNSWRHPDLQLDEVSDSRSRH
ncbi:hypothetical protein FJT64_025836 [Amphibalanus amphitrite]|uniref:G-protein coupled receptors family 1 profile domain-containing protein n=1 Tax=Amphibalanus amphitrite TaxID=1232801 RepID=A0A6A4WA37_AMPAM|nr:hypothetical protein FJT64_025836 [Amphibalanus amphitrite]